MAKEDWDTFTSENITSFEPDDLQIITTQQVIIQTALYTPLCQCLWTALFRFAVFMQNSIKCELFKTKQEWGQIGHHMQYVSSSYADRLFQTEGNLSAFIN